MTNLLENKHRKEKWKEANFVESLFPRAIPDVSDFLKIWFYVHIYILKEDKWMNEVSKRADCRRKPKPILGVRLVLTVFKT